MNEKFYPNPDQILFYPRSEMEFYPLILAKNIFYPFIQKERRHPILSTLAILATLSLTVHQMCVCMDLQLNCIFQLVAHSLEPGKKKKVLAN